MFSLKFFLAVLAIAIASSVIQWFFTGFLFHKYQSSTPSTWRKESYLSYTGSTILSLFFACMFVLIFSLWKSKYGSLNFVDGIEFSSLCWLAFSIPAEIGTAIYVNYSRMFVLGKCVCSFVEYIIAGILAVAIL